MEVKHMDAVSEGDIPDKKSLRLLETLERLLNIDGIELSTVLNRAAQQLAESLYADKVDIFLYEEESNSLVALGTSDTPMGRRQHALGLNRLPVVNRGRMVLTFQYDGTYITGHAEQDTEELVGITSQEGLNIHSEMMAPIVVEGNRRGILMASSSTANFFYEHDLHFLEAAAHWVSIMIHRAELIEQHTKAVTQQARRQTAEELITVLAHDLRNYLTPLRARLSLVENRAQREDRQKDIRDLGNSLSTLDRFQRLIANLLDVARLEQGIFSLTLQPVDLIDLVQETVPSFQTAQTPVHVQTQVQEAIISADYDRIRQVLENLLGNAVTHAPKQTPVEIAIETEEHSDGSWVRVRIRNKGPGIPADMQSRLFQPFVASTTSQGLGLGLYLARRISEAHNGHLTADSPAEGGVQFTLSLPIDNGESLS